MRLLNRFKSCFSYIRGSEHSGDIYRMVVEITNVCNLRCSMCPRNTMTRQAQHMDVGLFEEFLSKNHRSLEFVGLNGYGEPLLHPRLFDILSLCRRYKVTSGISTNCTMLKGDIAERLIEEGPDHLILAVDSVQKESYEKVRIGASFESVMDNVKGFLRLNALKRGRPFVVLQCIYMTETKGQVHDFIANFSEYKYDALRIRQLTYSGNKRADSDYKNRHAPCYWLWAEPMLLSNGQLTVCCQDVNGELVIGNVGDNSLSELWDLQKIRMLRRAHSEGKRGTIKICRDCNMYQPPILFALGAAMFDTLTLNKLLPKVETLLSKKRYKI